MGEVVCLSLGFLYKCAKGIIWNDSRREGSSSSCSSSSKWSHIDGDVLESIVERLSLSDYLRIRAVCSSWRTAAKAVANRRCFSSHELPLLLLFQKYDTNFSLYHLSTRRIIDLRRPRFLNSHITCFGTVQGWMIMTETDFYFSQTCVFFFDPVTQTRVYHPSRLPNIPTPVFKIVASATPTDPNCVVVCVFTDHCNFAFSRICSKSWTVVKGDKAAGFHFTEMEIYDGKLYAITDSTSSSILVYDLQEQPMKPKMLAKLPARPSPSIINLVGNIRYGSGNMLNFLAIDASRGEILLVYLFHNLAYARLRDGYINIVKEFVSPPMLTACQVFKLNMINSSEARWVEVDDLGDRSLFVARFKSLVASTRGLYGPEELNTKNSVYFTVPLCCVGDTHQWKGMQILRLCLTDRTVTDFTLERSSFATLPFPIWFIPSVW